MGGLPVNLKEQSFEEGLRSHGFQEVDAAFDTSGKGAARQTCLQILGKRGVLICIGHGETLNLNVSPDLIATERAVLGSEYFRFDELPANLELLRAHGAYLRQIITHRFGVGEIQPAFELLFRGETGKVVIEQ
ncbi:MAG: zinc-binding dehydrogenase [Chloroflexota bacterium]